MGKKGSDELEVNSSWLLIGDMLHRRGLQEQHVISFKIVERQA